MIKNRKCKHEAKRIEKDKEALRSQFNSYRESEDEIEQKIQRETKKKKS